MALRDGGIKLPRLSAPACEVTPPVSFQLSRGEGQGFGQVSGGGLGAGPWGQGCGQQADREGAGGPGEPGPETAALRDEEKGKQEAKTGGRGQPGGGQEGRGRKATATVKEQRWLSTYCAPRHPVWVIPILQMRKQVQRGDVLGGRGLRAGNSGCTGF